MLGLLSYLSVLKKESEGTAKKSKKSTLESDLTIMEAERGGDKKFSDAMIDDMKK